MRNKLGEARRLALSPTAHIGRAGTRALRTPWSPPSSQGCVHTFWPHTWLMPHLSLPVISGSWLEAGAARVPGVFGGPSEYGTFSSCFGEQAGGEGVPQQLQGQVSGPLGRRTLQRPFKNLEAGGLSSPGPGSVLTQGYSRGLPQSSPSTPLLGWFCPELSLISSPLLPPQRSSCRALRGWRPLLHQSHSPDGLPSNQASAKPLSPLLPLRRAALLSHH